MGRRLKQPREDFWARSRREIAENRRTFIVYAVLRLLVLATLILQALNRDFNNVFLCVLTLVLFTLPSFMEKRLKIDLPSTLEIIVLVFIFCAEILGEIREYYIIFPYWDSLLHTTTGFLCAAIGIAMIDILNRSDKFSLKLSPIYVALAAFCFSMTIGVLWEFLEFAADHFLHFDMQKDTWIDTIVSVSLHPEGKNIPVTVDVSSVVINGEVWAKGYLDIGLIDTMHDLLVNFIGAVVFSVIGFFYARSDGKGKFAKKFIPTVTEPPKGEDAPPEN